MNTTPSLILHHGLIYTLDAQRPWAEAVAVRGPYIAAVGSNDEILALAEPETNVIDLEGRLALPGLCDAHIHFYDWSIARRQVQLAGCAGKAEMLARIATRVEQTPPGQWIIGRGWNETGWPGRPLPTRDDLDSVTGPDRPAIFWRSDMHAAVVNSAALRISGITMSTSDPEGGVIGHDPAPSGGRGRPNGLLWELAINMVLPYVPKPTSAEVEDAFAGATAALHRWGITAVHDQRMKDQDDGPRALAAYQRLHERGELRLRVNCNLAVHDLPHLVALGLRTGFGDDYLRLGHVKLFSDGTMGSQTAWMLAPYLRPDPDNTISHGVVLTPPEQMAADFRRAVAGGFAVSVHAIGDRANREVLDVFEEVDQAGTPLSIPHRVEHVQIIDPADLPRLAQLGLTASVQPVHVTEDMDMAELVLGERAARIYNFRSLAESGALLALGSDAPVADPNPFLGFHAAICRQRVERMPAPAWYGNERLSLAQTVEGYTLGAAKAAGWDRVIGSIIAGKRADLIVLDRNLFELVVAGVTGSEIVDTQVVLALFDGDVVFQVSGLNVEC
jgi:predicted amidohydrolase YtcJ